MILPACFLRSAQNCPESAEKSKLQFTFSDIPLVWCNCNRMILDGENSLVGSIISSKGLIPTKLQQSVDFGDPKTTPRDIKWVRYQFLVLKISKKMCRSFRLRQQPLPSLVLLGLFHWNHHLPSLYCPVLMYGHCKPYPAFLNRSDSSSHAVLLHLTLLFH